MAWTLTAVNVSPNFVRKSNSMKRKLTGSGWIIILLFGILSAGCNKEGDELPPEFSELSFDEQEVIEKLPEGLLASTDPKAQECVVMIMEAMDMSAFQDNLEVPENAQRLSKKASSDTWSWTFSYAGETWTFYWTYSEDSSKEYWAMEIQYGEGDRYDYINAWEMKDGSAGEVVYSFNWVQLYDQEYMSYVDLHMTFTWSMDVSGTYHFGWTYEGNSTEYDYVMEYSIVIYADGSGALDYYYYDQLFYHMEWDASGNGSWTYYFGEMEESGSWTAG